MNPEFLELYKFGICNRIIKPEYEDYSDNYKLTITELVIKMYKWKLYLTFMFYYEYDGFFNELEKQMQREKSKIEYYIILLNKVIANTKLSFDLCYIFVSFLVWVVFFWILLFVFLIFLSTSLTCVVNGSICISAFPVWFWLLPRNRLK